MPSSAIEANPAPRRVAGCESSRGMRLASQLRADVLEREMADPRVGEDRVESASPRVEADLRFTPEARERVTLLRWIHRATLACAAPALALFVQGGARLDHPGVLVAL